jgi:CHRD domain
MKAFPGCILVLVIVTLAGCSHGVRAQNTGAGMAMPSSTLLVAQLDAKQVTGGSASAATGTGAFALDPVQHTLVYSLTYQGLQAGGAKSIALANFGKGKNGDVIRVLCGDGQPCPAGASATVSGRWERDDRNTLDNHLIGEFDSGRIYVVVTGGNGEQEIRGQLAPNDAMVPIANYVAHLQPVAGTNSKGSGTAVVSETYLPGGKIAVFYSATVADTFGIPSGAGLAVNQAASRHPFKKSMALPHLDLLSPRGQSTGGSIKGIYDVPASGRDALYVKRLMAIGKGEAGFVITTSHLPGGELYGTLVPVR